MSVVDQWRERSGEFAEAHQSLSDFMDRVKSGLEALEPQWPSVLFAVEVLSPHYFEYREGVLPEAFAESVRRLWPVDEWLMECFRRHCDDSIMTIDATDRNAPEYRKLGVAMAAACLVAASVENPTYAKIAEKTSDLLAAAEMYDTSLVPAVLDAARLMSRDDIIDEFAVEVSMKEDEIRQLRQGTFLDRLKAVLSWPYVSAETFYYSIADLQDRFADEVGDQFAIHLREQIEAGDIEAMVAALHIGTSCHDGSVARDYLRKLTDLPLVRPQGKLRSDYVSDVIKFDHAACAIEPIHERVQDVIDETYLDTLPLTGSDYRKKEAGEMGLLKRWHEAAPDDPRIPGVVRCLAESFLVGYRRKLRLYGLDRLVPMVPATKGED